MTASERRAPVQGEWGTRNGRWTRLTPDGTISWEEHAEAWRGYRGLYSGANPEEMARRGGFNMTELREYLGREPKTFVPNNEQWR